MIDFLLRVFSDNLDQDAVVWRDQVFSFGWMLNRVEHWKTFLSDRKIETGAVVALEADFSPNAIALFLALIENRNVIVPLSGSVQAKKQEFLEIAQVKYLLSLDEYDAVFLSDRPSPGRHPFYEELMLRLTPGLVLFSSGSTGKSKAAVHDLGRILEKFKVPRHKQRMISFLLFDHIGGINTMLYTLSNGGCLVTVADRTPDSVLSAVDRYRVDILPTSPTFINLILISEAYRHHALSSLKTVTYGTEPMPESTLKRFHELFPAVSLLQTYGLSEVGILRSKSRSSDSLWVKIGGEGFETRVVDGLLEIKAQSAMLGYLNAPSPFTADGWFKTGDAVEVDGDYIRILGRKSELINVGGEKVYPQEVESIIMELDNVAEATVYGEKNAITGNIVCARVRLKNPEDHRRFATRLKKYCSGRMERYKVPVRIIYSEEHQFGERFKKRRI